MKAYTADQTRKDFKKSNPSFTNSKLTTLSIIGLYGCIKIELEGTNFKVEPITNKNTIKDKNGDYSYLLITCRGPYFKGREAVSFSLNGFIGFAGWASPENQQPFIRAFRKWAELDPIANPLK